MEPSMSSRVKQDAAGYRGTVWYICYAHRGAGGSTPGLGPGVTDPGLLRYDMACAMQANATQRNRRQVTRNIQYTAAQEPGALHTVWERFSTRPFQKLVSCTARET